MLNPYFRAVITAEIKRALRDHRPVDRQWLRAETGRPMPVVEIELARQARRMFREALR